MAKGSVSIIGNLVIDKIFIKKKCTDSCPGGTAFYAGMALAKLRAQVELVSKIGVDYPDRFLKILKKAGINFNPVIKSKSQHSTSFMWHYSDDLKYREGRISCRGPDITPADIPRHINKSACVHLGMVANEIDPQVLSILDYDNIGLIGADLHFIREISEDGRIKLGKGDIFRPFLHKIHVIKGSFEEVAAFANTVNIRHALRKVSSMGTRIVFATDGANGSILFTRGRFFQIPAYKVKVVETTGAGDIFLSSFLYFHGVRGEDPVESAFLASAAVSCAVEGNGVSRLGGEEKIRKRVKLLHNH